MDLDKMAAPSVILFFIGYSLPYCLADTWISNRQHQLIIEEGRSNLVTIETSFPEYQQTCTTLQVVTLQEYVNTLHVVCKVAQTDHLLLSTYLNQTEPTFLDLDQAEVADLSIRSYTVSFVSGATTFSLEVADDDIYENEEIFVIYIDIPELCNERLRFSSLAKIRDNDDLFFTWNIPRINVYEDEGIIDKLWILKNGSHEDNIILNVQVHQANDTYEAVPGRDFYLLQTAYTVYPQVYNLSVPFEIVNDTVREVPEHFHLIFSYQHGENSDNIIQPLNSTVTVNILDRVKFTAQPKNVTSDYGRTVKMACASTSNAAPTWIIGHPNGDILTYVSISHLPAHVTPTHRGIDITIQDLRLNLTNYTCSINVFVPNPVNGSISHVLFLSHTGILTITFPSVSFYLLYQKNHSAQVRIGETVDFQIIKDGGGNHTYTVTIHSSDSSITDDLYFIFDQNTSETDATVTIPGNITLEDSLQFEILIANVSAEGYGTIGGVTGEPISVTLYDNKYVIDLTPNEIRSKQIGYICANITKPSVIDPQAIIPLSFTQLNSCIILEVDEFLLSHVNQSLCSKVQFVTNCCNNLTLQLHLLKNYDVILRPQEINIIIDDNCNEHDNRDPKEMIYILPAIIFLLGSIVLVITIIIVFRPKYRDMGYYRPPDVIIIRRERYYLF